MSVFDFLQNEGKRHTYFKSEIPNLYIPPANIRDGALDYRKYPSLFNGLRYYRKYPPEPAARVAGTIVFTSDLWQF